MTPLQAPSIEASPRAVLRRVPRDLIPVHYNDTSVAWGAATFQYYHLFDTSIRTTAYKDESELINWARCANRIQVELKTIGMERATATVMDLCKHEFKLVNTDGQAPTSLDDVIAIIREPRWYNEDRNHSRMVVYMLSYGIFRNCYNCWANDAAAEWMRENNIAYLTPIRQSQEGPETGKERKTRAGKGFVYRNIISRASNTISNRFQEATKTTFSEYICVRSGRGQDNEDVQALKFQHFSAHLVTLRSLTSAPARDRFRTAVAEAYRAKLSTECILGIVNDAGASLELTPTSEHPDINSASTDTTPSLVSVANTPVSGHTGVTPLETDRTSHSLAAGPETPGIGKWDDVNVKIYFLHLFTN